jgi:hypothetical protein
MDEVDESSSGAISQRGWQPFDAIVIFLTGAYYTQVHPQVVENPKRSSRILTRQHHKDAIRGLI